MRGEFNAKTQRADLTKFLRLRVLVDLHCSIVEYVSSSYSRISAKSFTKGAKSQERKGVALSKFFAPSRLCGFAFFILHDPMPSHFFCFV